MKILKMLKRLWLSTKTVNNDFIVEKIVFDIEWDREVLMLKNKKDDSSFILSLDLEQEYENSINSRQLMFEQFSPLMEKLALKVRNLYLYKNEDLKTVGQCQFKLGLQWKTVEITLQECVSLSLVYDLSLSISPELLLVHKQFKSGFLQQDPLHIQHTNILGQTAHYDNEVVM